MINIIFYVIIMTMIGAFGSLFLKKASGKKINLNNLDIYIGGILYFVSALINIYVLKYLDYSIVLPLTSITYIWTMILAKFYLKEKIGIKKIIGITVIIFGIVLISI